ncbi:MAG: membrane dipeptidase [Planctomycetaceae bacterium]|nr:membrane dipeptidase [Planctomycetaceae bacterium]
MLIFDAHLDMAWNAVEWNRNLMLSVQELRQFEAQFENIVPGEPTITWPALKEAGVGITISTLLPRLHRKDGPLSHYQSREAAYGSAMGQLAYYRAMCKRGVIREIPDAATLKSHVEEWEAGPTESTPVGFILSMEGSPPILYPEQIHDWYAEGLRLLGPGHYGEAPYCFGTGSEGGLKPGGKELLQAMNECGMLLDTTHLADQSFWEALDVYEGPLIASHQNSRTLVPRDRQFTDEQFKAVAERGGMIGASFDNWMLHTDWKIGVSDPSMVTMENVADHIDYVVQLLGTTKHSGLGTDLDGGFGKEQCPSDLGTIHDLGNIAGILEKRGYSQEDIDGIMYKNFVEFFLKNL